MTLYITKEPCLMCYNAIMLSRIKNIIYGCSELKFKKLNNIYRYQYIKNKINIKCNILSVECRIIISTFFYNQRYLKKIKHNNNI